MGRRTKDRPYKTIAIIASAGKARRLGGEKKVYLPLNGIPMLSLTISPFEKSKLVDAIIIVAAKEDIRQCREKVVKKAGFKKVVDVIPGGKERQDSIRNALNKLDDTWDFAIVHDGARPLVTTSIIEDAVRTAYKYGSAVTGVPVKDTIKEIKGPFIKRTIPRNTLFSIQTPQVFGLKTLKKAYALAKRQRVFATDDSFLVERLGKKVRHVIGSYENIKVTTKEDIAISEALLRLRGKP